VDLLSRRATTGRRAFTDQGRGHRGALPHATEQAGRDLHAGADELLKRASVANLGAVGFCFGGGMTWNLLQAGPGQEKRLKVAVPFYGPAPAAPDFAGSNAAVLAIYGALDTRVDASRDAITQALEKAGLRHEIVTYDGANTPSTTTPDPATTPRPPRPPPRNCSTGWTGTWRARPRRRASRARRVSRARR